MAEPHPTPETMQITTTDVEPLIDDAGANATTPAPRDEAADASSGAAASRAQGGGQPRGQLDEGVGIEGEFVVWEDRYSYKNFVGRLVLHLVATFAWMALAYWVWGRNDEASRSLRILAGIAGAALLLYWLFLGWRVFYARKSHFYRLTNKRLFVWTGVFRRRIDQLELLKVNDVYTKIPSIFHRMLGVGTVVVESSEERYPVTYIVGVDRPEAVMDTVWHTARAEREGHTVRVDQV